MIVGILVKFFIHKWVSKGLVHLFGQKSCQLRNTISAALLLAIDDAITSSQIDTSGISRLTGFLTEKVNKPI
jgi:hypothetical protein